ncbi:thioesterase II family protein [Kitasatospora griseola]|uniref:thioesterase II family protein n=1 Tax=Kitasatospora griseola TaxID=2064 RepID=UPI003439D920
MIDRQATASPVGGVTLKAFGQEMPNRLLCLPYAGGSATAYVPWTMPLAQAGISLIAAQLPGRQDQLHLPTHRTFELLVADLADQAQRIGAPYAVFGHSFGATLAFDLARELQRRGTRMPVCLIVSGAPAPHCADDSVSEASSDAELLDHIQSLDGTPPDVIADAELVEIFLRSLKADTSLLSARLGQGGGQLRGVPAFAYGGSVDTTVTMDQLRGWLDYGTGGRIRVFTGDHFFPWGSDQRFWPALLEDLGSSFRRTG